MSGTSAGWTPERRAAQSAFMTARNREPEFVNQRRKGQGNWTEEQRRANSERLSALNADPAFRAKQREGCRNRTYRRPRIPQQVHPCVRGFFVEMYDQHATRADITARAGISSYSQSDWKKRSMPMLDTIDAALNALGLELAIVPRGSRDDNGFYKRPQKAAKGE